MKIKSIIKLLSYRKRLSVKNTKVYSQEDYIAFAICPRCDNVIIRDYSEYCQNCGQHLGWKRYSNMFPDIN